VRARSTEDTTGVSTVSVSLSIEIRVDSWVSLVGKVGLVRPCVGRVGDTTVGSGVSSRVVASMSAGVASRASRAGCGVNAGIELVGHAGVVGCGASGI